MIYQIFLFAVAALVYSGVDAFDITPPISVATPEPGLRYTPAGHFEPAAKLEMFLDLNCGDSANAFPIIKRVADHYGNQVLNLVVQHLPLPYHRNSVLSFQGMFLIQEHSPFTTFNYIDAMLAQNANFSTANTKDMSENEVLEMIADVAVASTGIDRDLFIQNIGLYRSNVVQAWKYSIKRLNASTPSFSLNGVDLAITGVPTYEDWIAYLDPIINSL